jgi:hypothetical protein
MQHREIQVWRWANMCHCHPRRSGCRPGTKSGRRAAVSIVWLVLAQCARPPSPVVSVDAGPSAPASAAQALAHVAPEHVEVGAPSLDSAALAPRDARADGDAGAVPAAPLRPRKGRGVRCERSRECALGLVCCESGFRGTCGGAFSSERETADCVITRSCEPPPCEPFALPP